MRQLSWLAVGLLLITGSAWAINLGPAAPTIKDSPSTPAPATDGREGGETVWDAVVIPALWFTDTGATCDNLNDYDEACPYLGSLSPDVVYVYSPTSDDNIHIDLCGSAYDTKVYVYENEVTVGIPYACNDDFYYGEPCENYVSKIEYLNVFAGNDYYIVVDGYGGQCGEYELNVYISMGCPIDCPPGYLLEGEPPLHDEYVDMHNSGCSGHPVPIWQPIQGQGDECASMCAVSGWYSYQGLDYRDTDWFEVRAAGEEITWTVLGEYALHQFVILPDCALMDLIITESPEACVENTVTVPTAPGEVFWLWVAPQAFAGPVQEFGYLMDICGIIDDPIPVQNMTWGQVKRGYR